MECACGEDAETGPFAVDLGHQPPLDFGRGGLESWQGEWDLEESLSRFEDLPVALGTPELEGVFEPGEFLAIEGPQGVEVGSIQPFVVAHGDPPGIQPRPTIRFSRSSPRRIRVFTVPS